MAGSINSVLTVHNTLLAFVALFALAALIMRYPEFGIALLAVFPVILKSVEIIRSTLLIWVAVLTAISLFWYVSREPINYLNRLINNSLIWFVCLLYSCGIFTYIMFGASPYGNSLFILKNQLITFVLVIIGLMIITPDKERLKRHIFSVCLVMAVYHFLYGYIMIDKINHTFMWRCHTNLLGYSIGSAAAGSFMSVIIVLCHPDIFSPDKFKRLFQFAFLILPIFIVIFSGTRIAWPSAIIGVAVCSYYLKYFGVIKLVLRGFVIVVIIIIVSMYFLTQVNEAVYSVGSRFSKAIKSPQDALGPRIDGYEAGIKQFASSPVFGVGIGGGGEVVIKHVLRNPTETIIYRQHIHNMVLSILAEQGIVGFALFVALYTTAIRYALIAVKRKNNDSFGFRLGIVAISGLFASAVLGITGSSPTLYWLFGISYVAYYHSKAEPIGHVTQNPKVMSYSHRNRG